MKDLFTYLFIYFYKYIHSDIHVAELIICQDLLQSYCTSGTLDFIRNPRFTIWNVILCINNPQPRPPQVSDRCSSHQRSQWTGGLQISCGF